MVPGWFWSASIKRRAFLFVYISVHLHEAIREEVFCLVQNSLSCLVRFGDLIPKSVIECLSCTRIAVHPYAIFLAATLHADTMLICQSFLGAEIQSEIVAHAMNLALLGQHLHRILPLFNGIPLL